MAQSCDEILTELNLSEVRVLQDVGIKRTLLVKSPNNELSVLKFHRIPDDFFLIELEFLKKISGINFKYLALPELISYGDNYFQASYVDRIDYTRDTIAQHPWTIDAIHTLCNGITEFQSISMPAQAFSFKQRFMGYIYPITGTVIALPKALKRKILKPSDLIFLPRLILIYLCARIFNKNKIAHYDLTTLNCSFTPSDKLSILDFEFSYHTGDDIFDLVYFLTIPPVSLKNWTYQKSALNHFLKNHKGSYHKQRLQLILFNCILRRALHFSDNSAEQQKYIEGLNLLRNTTGFNSWIQARHTK